MITSIIGTLLCIALFLYSKHLGYCEGVSEAYAMYEKILLAHGYAEYKIVDKNIIFEVKDGQRTVDSDGERKEAPPTESKS